jgi:hypothetical protein
MKETALDTSALALQLAQDKRFRKNLLSAVDHSLEAGRRAHRGRLLAAAQRMAADQALQREVRQALADLQRAYGRFESKKRSHKLRNAGLFAVGLAIALWAVRDRLGWSSSQVLPQAEKRPASLEDLSKDELYRRAQEADIPGRSEMSKEEIVSALRAKNH